MWSYPALAYFRIAARCFAGSGPQVIDSAISSSATSFATASKCEGSGSSHERLLSIAAVGQCSWAVRRAVASSLAQQTVTSA
jgi:hypothetical protein